MAGVRRSTLNQPVEDENEEQDPLDSPTTGSFELPNPPVPEPRQSTHFDPQMRDRDQNPFDSLAIPLTSRVKQIWAIGGGKGGVGKSLLAANLGISLSRMRKKVTAIDLDLGAANLHTALGVGLPKKSLGDFFTGRTENLQDCVTDTSVTNLSLISGARDAVTAANLDHEKKVNLFQRMREIDSDYLILDLGAGTSVNTLDFFLFADIGLNVLLPEPTSIENVYRFLKSIYYRRLRLSPRLANVQNLIEAAMDTKNKLGINTPSDLLREIERADPESAMTMAEEVEKLNIKLIVNQARTQTDIDIGFSVKSVVKKYFGINMDYIGYLDYDSAVWQSVRRKRPLMTEFPNSQLVSNFERITNYLIKKHNRYRNNFY